MIRAKVTISQRVKISKTVDVEANSYDDLFNEATSEVGFCLVSDYDDYDDFELECIDVIQEDDE